MRERERERERNKQRKEWTCVRGLARARLVAPGSTEVRQRIHQRTPASTKVRYFQLFQKLCKVSVGRQWKEGRKHGWMDG
jgi:hypothetical protein